MLAKLSISNYALIDNLQVDFDGGFSVITGETGAGKSILLGGLSLVLGKRADLSSLREKGKKCIVEADFKIADYGLGPFFEEHDLDYEELTVVRREILPSGKSRAFINDTPVNLGVLSQLGDHLLDIHSQHQTLQLTENAFQFKLVDALAGTKDELLRYKGLLSQYQSAQKALEALQIAQQNALKEKDYNAFLLSELEAAPLEHGILETLEETHAQLNNMELITEELAKGTQLMEDEQMGLLQLVAALRQTLGKLSGFNAQYADVFARVQAVAIELDDIGQELHRFQDRLEADPGKLEVVNAQLQALYDLQRKHGVQEITELIAVRDALSQQAFETASLEEKMAQKTQEISQLRERLQALAATLTKKRNKALPGLKAQLEADLSQLGMPSASFEIGLRPETEFKANGKDALRFLFSANKGTAHGELKKVASGGELSRIMLVIKALLAKYEKLPTIMFDEIDTGVSGEISQKMAQIMHQMSQEMQVFSITHLPQVASKGAHHFKVFKFDENQMTRTDMKRLGTDERITELAQMLGGKQLTDSALAHAKQLLDA
ncbi:DNA repair protein RecN [Maribacter sp. 2307ULW6-5]|uniref:DNA repair protein RecN n=1 Tax=Maribacter sp. 2307ULW6-5 TaxID=3386275 RepID=UPI0039BCB961